MFLEKCVLSSVLSRERVISIALSDLVQTKELTRLELGTGLELSLYSRDDMSVATSWTRLCADNDDSGFAFNPGDRQTDTK
jgi:hypothetical protein